MHDDCYTNVFVEGLKHKYHPSMVWASGAKATAYNNACTKHDHAGLEVENCGIYDPCYPVACASITSGTLMGKLRIM
jgi:hypothetical protein